MEKLKEQSVESYTTGNESTYSWGLDLIRIIAMFFVILVHATSMYHFEGAYDVPTFIAALSRWLSYTCIPLFMILTGYLQANKRPTLNYYLKLIKILIEFFITGFVVASIYWICFGSTTPWWEILGKMLLFSYPSYSWYINMYIGLFILAPFFNYLYKAVPDKEKWLFMISLVILFSCPQVSSYWGSAYPIMYYFIGSFLKDKQFKLNKWLLLGVIIVGCFWQMLMCVIPLYGVESHNNIGCLVLSLAIFMLLYQAKVNTSSTHKMRLAKVLRVVANASLGTFLVSEVFESYNGIYFDSLGLTTFSEKLPYLTYLTPIKFIFSVIIGIAISFVATLIYKLVLFGINKIRDRKKTECSQDK